MFFRTLFVLLLAIVVLTAIRMFAGVLTKGIGSMFDTPKPTGPTHPPAAPAGGDLKRDPVCGTFIPASTSIKQTFHGEVVHFCSAACRDSYKPARSAK